MENNRIYAIVKWYDVEKGYGIALHDEVLLFVHKSYFSNGINKLLPNDEITCIPLNKNNIYHAKNIELYKKEMSKTMILEQK